MFSRFSREVEVSFLWPHSERSSQLSARKTISNNKRPAPGATRSRRGAAAQNANAKRTAARRAHTVYDLPGKYTIRRGRATYVVPAYRAHTQITDTRAQRRGVLRA